MSDMYNFDNNNYNNENHDGFNHYEFDENNSNTPNHKKPNAKMVKFAKKVGAIALSAVLFGGVAAGSYQGVNALFGTSTQTEAQATTTRRTKVNEVLQHAAPNHAWQLPETTRECSHCSPQL